MALMVMGILFIGELMLNSIREDKKFTASVINTTAVLGFKKIGNEISESAGASVDYLHLPISVTCPTSYGTSPRLPCIREFNSTTQKFTALTQINIPRVVPSGTANASTIEFFRDESTPNSSGLMEPIAEDPALPNEWKKLKNDGIDISTSVVGSHEIYATWVLQQPTSGSNSTISPNPFVFLRYSKDNRYFALEPSVKDVSNPTYQHTLFMPNPTINVADSLAPYTDKLFVVTAAEDNTKYFIAKTNSSDDIKHCAQTQGPNNECKNAWNEANPLNESNPSGPYPNTPVTTPEGQNPSDQLLAMRLSPAQSSIVNYLSTLPLIQTMSTNPTALTASPPDRPADADSNFFLFPTLHTSYYKTGTGNPLSFHFGTSTDKTVVNLVQKFASALPTNNNLVAAPVELSVLYLKQKPTGTCIDKDRPPCASLVMKTYPSYTEIVLLDEVSNGGFILITRRLGKSELNFRIYNQSIESVIP